MTGRQSDAAISHHADADRLLAAGNPNGAIAVLMRGLNTSPDDFSGWIKLSVIKRRMNDPDGALQAVNRAVDIHPTDVLALLLKASLHERLGDAFRAAEIYRAALHVAPESGDLPAHVTTQLGHARSYLAQYRRAVETRLGDGHRLGPEHLASRIRFLDNILDRRTDFHQQPTHYRYPGLADVEFFDFAYPDFLDRLRAAFPAIRAEFIALLERHANRQQPYVDFGSGQPVGQWAALNRSSDWNALHLERYGEVDPINAAACPHTMAALSDSARADIPGLAPNLMFSLLRAKTHIPAHHGVANFRSVLHLPLIVPPGCRFRVGGETRIWVEGEPLIFDDTIEHEAWNDSDALRVILIADVWRPELDETDRKIVRDVIAAQDSNAMIGAL